MEKSINLIVVVLLIASAIFLGSSVALFFMRQVEIEKRIMLQDRVSELTKEKTRLSQEIDDITVLKNEIEIKLVNLQEKANLLKGQLDEERKTRESIFVQLEREKKESKKFLDEFMQLKDQKEKLSAELRNLNNEHDMLKTQLYSVQQAKEILEHKFKKVLAKNEIELEKIVVRPEFVSAPGNNSSEVIPEEAPEMVSSDGLQGEILVVNKRFDFTVVNLGEYDGLKPGMDLGVYRDKRFLAMLKVEKVHVNMAAAKIPPEWKNVGIREGDKVVVIR